MEAFRRRFASPVLLVAALVSCKPHVEREPVVPHATAAVEVDTPAIPEAAIYRDLDLRFGTLAAPQPALPQPTLRERVRAFVADRMQRDEFYDTIAFEFVRSSSDAGWPAIPYTLKHDDKDAYYYLTKPCDRSARVSVTPWWDTSSTIQICRDDYRPTVVSFERTPGEVTYCEGTHHAFFLDPNSPCRCGEYLVNCAPNKQMQSDLLEAFDEEQVRTFEHVVQDHLPITSLMTMSDTVRSDLADFYYARAELLRTGTFNYPTPKPGSAHLRPRPAHFTSGLMTTHNWLASDDGVRVRAAALLQLSLCDYLGSAKVKPAEMFDALHGDGTATFRQAVRMELTTTKGCENCHKSLENVALALQSYPIAQFGSRYVEQKPLTTKLYIDGDLRADGPATGEWLANTIVAQPEYTSCFVDTSLQFLFDGQQPPVSAREKIVAQFASTKDFASMFTEAVLLRYLSSEQR